MDDILKIRKSFPLLIPSNNFKLWDGIIWFEVRRDFCGFKLHVLGSSCKTYYSKMLKVFTFIIFMFAYVEL